jgi:hypothetical protein
MQPHNTGHQEINIPATVTTLDSRGSLVEDLELDGKGPQARVGAVHEMQCPGFSDRRVCDLRAWPAGLT